MNASTAVSVQRSVLMALLTLCALQACHESNTPSAGGNSNWLTSCESSSDCEGGSCLCGVCTTTCERDSECSEASEDAVCIDPSTSGIASDCAATSGTGSAEGNASVCLLGCSDDTGCDRGQRCLQGACIASSVLTAVGEVDGPCDGSGSCNDGLRCDEDRVCVASETAPCDAGACVDANMGPPSEPSLQLGDACEAGECEEGLSCERGVCAEPWSGPGCEPAAADRAPCGAGDTCPEDLVCHVDGTCIEPGRCDAAGEATLVGGGDAQLVGLTSTHVVLRYPETRDALNNPQGDARFARLSHAGGALETIAGGLSGSLEAQLVGDSLIFQDGSLWEVPVDGSQTPRSLGVEPTLWHADASHVYYVRDREIRRLERAAPQNDEQLAPDTVSIAVQILVDDTTLYVFGDAGGILSMPKGGGTLSSLTQLESFVPEASLGPQRIFVSSDGSVYSIDRNGGDRYTVVLDDLATRVRSHREHVYFHGFGGFKRAPKTPGESTLLAESPPSRVEDIFDIDDFAVGDAGFYRFHEGRLVRLVLPDLAGAKPPQGQLDGPCFDDGLCTDGSTCLDLLCSN